MRLVLSPFRQEKGLYNDAFATLPGRTILPLFPSCQRRIRTFRRQRTQQGGQRTLSGISEEYRPDRLLGRLCSRLLCLGKAPQGAQGVPLPSKVLRPGVLTPRAPVAPEQVARHLENHGLLSISFQTIHRWIRNDKPCGGGLHRNLRIMLKRRRKRAAAMIPEAFFGQHHISDRPAYVNDRLEFRHWEADTVRKDRHQRVFALVACKIGLARLSKPTSRTVENAAAAIARIISAEPAHFKTTTFNNSTDFLSYKNLEEWLPFTCYFANLHHLWKRGPNENFRGLLRLYIPKGHPLDYIGERKLDALSERLNYRPRKHPAF
jgi:transposase, IS30 family